MMGYVLGRHRFPGKRIVAGVLAAAIFLPEGYTIIPVFDLINKLHLHRSGTSSPPAPGTPGRSVSCPSSADAVGRGPFSPRLVQALPW